MALLVEGVRQKYGEAQKLGMGAAEEGDQLLGSLEVFCTFNQRNKRSVVPLCRDFLSA